MVKNKIHINIADPSFNTQEKTNLLIAIKSNWVSSLGPFVKKFEEDFAKFCEVKYALAVHSGTAALHLALLALEIKKSDEVIIPNLTYIATANAVRYVDATPILCDVEFATGNIDPKQIEKLITKKTKAIIVVHLYGNPCAMKEINSIAKRYKLKIIEDAAEAHGSTYMNKNIGSLSNIACFSFYGNKTITTGEGGMLVSNNKILIDKAFTFANQGRSEKNHYFHPVLGYNYRMTNLQAAVGVAQLKKLKIFIKKKRYIFSFYKNHLKNVGGISFIEEKEGSQASWWMSSILIADKNQKAKLIKFLKYQGIQTMQFFTPINQQPIYKSNKIFPNSQKLYQQGLVLPSSVTLGKSELIYVTNMIKSILKK